MMELWTQPWWTWNPATAGAWDRLYRTFNLLEGTAWFVFAGLVLWRWTRFRHSPLETVYAAAFALFGATDLMEASQQSAPLVVVKGIVLVSLLLVRRIVRGRWYPASSLY